MSRKFELRAGVAREIISPPKGIYLIGYGDRTKGNLGIHDELTATALLLDDGERRIALVACDLLAINKFVVERVQEQLRETAEVIISCSHTHAGPLTYADWRSGPRRRAYVQRLVARIVRAVRRAAEHLTPVTLSGGQTVADIAVNRRERQPDGSLDIGVNPGGPRDREVGVVQLRTARGVPLATIVNFACHGTVLGPANRQVSADWIGAMRTQVEAQLGGLMLFLQGATADLNPVRNVLGPDEQPWEAVETLGKQVADAVAALCKNGLTTLPSAPLELRRRELWLPLEAKVTSNRPPRTYRQILLAQSGLPPFLSWAVDWLLWHRYPWRSRIEARQGRWTVPLQINVLRAGALGLVTLGAETFTEIGQSLKAVAPTPHTLFASVTDGCIGYLPTASAHAAGGPEVDLFSYFYRYPGRFAAESAALAIQAVSEMWEAM
ncbi:MAG: neutral/alkaline non-lysosomal ceramidase N-terminal domain-containing protein [Chloroflexota bacterium]|nr:neutral/alkaline non-lysosomal ceramidase N-terminal domain-containing protein [Chloroflexota bacterium]